MNKISKLLIVEINCFLMYVAVFTLLSAYPWHANAKCYLDATKQCISNIVYWHDSCGALQSIYQNCNITNQICQNGQCINKLNDDSLVKKDNNQNTPGQIVNTEDKIQEGKLAISFFIYKESSPMQWEKSINATDNDKINFLLIVKNISPLSVDNAFVKTDIPDTILDFSDLKIDNLSSDKNIISKIDLGTVEPKKSKVISFTGLPKLKTNQNTIQITATTNVLDATHDSDYVTINIKNEIVKNQIAAAAILESTTTTGNSWFNNIKKSWYIWITIVITLIIVFIIIFKKLSSNI